MIKERIQEIFEFSRGESPYRKANKGWINQDVFLDLSPSSNTLKEKNEAAKVTVLWSPINTLLSNIFLILIIGSIIVFTSLSFARGRFDFNLFDKSVPNEIVKADADKDQETSYREDQDSINSTIQKNIDLSQLDSSSIINSFDDNQNNSDQKIKIDKKEILQKDIESQKDIKILQNKKTKSNFI